MPTPRVSLLRQLIEYRDTVDATIAELAAYGWDSDEALVRLQAKDIEAILKRYLDGELSAAQVTDWADLIECREDIDSGPSEGTLSNVIFQLANPNLRAEITQALARDLLARLGGQAAHGKVD